MKGRKITATSDLHARKKFFHDAVLEVKGDLFVEDAFEVTGHVVVHGLYMDMEQCSVEIGGNLRAANVSTDGDLTVGGSIFAKGIVYACGGTVRAKTIDALVVVADDHDVQAAVKAKTLYLDRDACAKKSWTKLTKLLANDVLLKGEFDRERLYEMLLDQRQIWKK